MGVFFQFDSKVIGVPTFCAKGLLINCAKIRF